MVDALSRARAVGAVGDGHHRAEEGLTCRLDASLAVAGRACHRIVARFGAGPVARHASDGSSERHLPLEAERGLVEVEFETHRDILTAIRPTGRATESSEAAEPPSAEELLEDVLEAAELAEEILAAEGLAAIVTCAFLGVGEHFVRLGDLPEPVFGLCVPWVRIGVCLAGEATKRLLDLLWCRVAGHAEHRVVVRHVPAPKRSSSRSVTPSTTRIVRL